MNKNGWYSTPNNTYTPGYSSSPTPLGGGAADSVQDSHGLLAVYPFASITPATHVARHLSSLSISSTPPSYVQPHLYGGSLTPHVRPHFPSSSQYTSELNHLGASFGSSLNGRYWETMRNDAVKHLGEQEFAYTYYNTVDPWQHAYRHPSNHQSASFAQSVFQHSLPSAAYPTPPPPGISTSSSSLAHALEEPATRPAKQVYEPEESKQFFDEFVTKSSSILAASRSSVSNLQATPRRSKTSQRAEESPDPLALGFSSPQTPTQAVTTPRKRQNAAALDSPFVKRRQLGERPRLSSSTASGSASLSMDISPSKHQGTSTPKKLHPYVDVPPLPKTYITPTSRNHQRSELQTPSSHDKGKGKARELDAVEKESPSRSRSSVFLCVSIKSPSKRATGERDDRGPVEKLMTLLDDIFEAEDALSPDCDLHNLSSEFFSPHTVDSTCPLLHPNVVRKLSSLIAKVARPSKRIRISSREGNSATETPRHKGRMAEIDTSVLSRALKILERSVKFGEDLDPFRIAFSKDLLKNVKSGSMKAPGGGQESADEITSPIANELASTQEPTEADMELFSKSLDIARDSVLAADCCIAILGSDKLTKQLYSEELITMCLNSVKNQLSAIVYPFVEASAEIQEQISPLLRLVINPTSRDSSQRRQVAEIFQAISSVIPRINDLFSADTMAMSETIIILAVYIAIGPFFIAEGGSDEVKGRKDNAVLHTLGNSAMRGLRLDALALVRSIFANHEEQRGWIIEEILSSLIKLSDSKQKVGQFRLRDGRSIRTVSALLLQLVQTSAHDIRVDASTLRNARNQDLALRRESSFGEKSDNSFLNEKDLEEIRLYTSGLDSATKAAKTIIAFLTQRSGKSKVTKNSNEAEYRLIFDNLISDLLVVLFWPEWPAASLLLSIICKFMVSSLDEIKTVYQSENNAMRMIALDHLGTIAARLRSTAMKYHGSSHHSTDDNLVPLDEALLSADLKRFHILTTAHRELSSYLSKRSLEDQAYESARELTAVIWGQELAHALQQCGTMITESEEESFDPQIDRGKIILFGKAAKDVLRRIWDDMPMDVFELGSHDETAHIHRLSEEIGSVQSLKNSFSPILNVVLQALDAPPVFMRTKALKALGQIITSDPSILSTPSVRKAIESHLLDSSSAVRDAAVELIGRYIIDYPEFAADYFYKIAERIADTGLGVRKRVIKLLRSLYAVSNDRARRIDICTRIVLRMSDEDDTVKDLAVKAMEELWFQDLGLGGQRGKNGSALCDKAPLLSKVAVIMGVSSHFKDRQSPLEDLLHIIMVDKEGGEMSLLHARYAEICETLIEGLVDATDLPGFTVVNCVRTIHLFASAYPAVLSGTNASTLLPYLKNASTPEEQITSDYLLRIFRVTIPCMPKTAAKFGQELQLALQPMIVKPSSAGGLLGLQETVACMCASVQYLTHDFGRLVALLKSCNIRLQQTIRKPPSPLMTAPEQRTLSILLFIVSLLCEHCAFDEVRAAHADLRPELDSITKSSIIEHVYRILLDLYQKHPSLSLQGRILQCLGFLFRAQPALMTAETSASIMDEIFASSDEEACGRLLKIFQDFLTSEAAKHAAKEKVNPRNKAGGKVSMEELVGNSDGFADSGVSSAIVQRYLNPILRAAMSSKIHIQATAVDILSFTIKQGLAHPLQSFPVIVALETSPNASFSARASALHAILHSKHTSLLNARFVASARASFVYQKQLAPGQISGYRLSPCPAALLERWYALVREKRATRQDFLKALVKVFDIELNAKSSQDDVEFVRYMAENFAAFDYKTQEEVLTVLKYLTAMLSTTGMQLVEALAPSHLLTQLRATPVPSRADMREQPVDVGTPASSSVPPAVPCGDRLPLMRTSVIVGMVTLLKAYLKALYGISEDKSAKWVIGKKTAIGDKPAVRRHERPITWDRLPFARTPLLSSSDCDVQTTMFLEIWNEDGLIAEPEDDFP